MSETIRDRLAVIDRKIDTLAKSGVKSSDARMRKLGQEREAVHEDALALNGKSTATKTGARKTMSKIPTKKMIETARKADAAEKAARKSATASPSEIEARYNRVKALWATRVTEVEASLRQITDPKLKADLTAVWNADKARIEAHAVKMEKAVALALGRKAVEEYTPEEIQRHADRVQAAEANARAGNDSWAAVERVKKAGPTHETKAAPASDPRLVHIISQANRGMASQADVAKVKAAIAAEAQS
jgi:hypothetical protein